MNNFDLDFIEKGMKLPIPAPKTSIVRLEMIGGKLAVFMFLDKATCSERDAFGKGFESYSYFEANRSCPVAIWSFMFPAPIGVIEVNFDATLITSKHIESILDLIPGEADNLFTFLLIDNQIVTEKKLYNVSPLAAERFLSTMRKQRAAGYSKDVFNTALDEVYLNTPEEVFNMGKVFRVLK